MTQPWPLVRFQLQPWGHIAKGFVVYDKHSNKRRLLCGPGNGFEAAAGTINGISAPQ
jgi:hypothetical protein